MSVKIAAIIILLFIIFNTASITRLKYSKNDFISKNTFVLDEVTTNYWSWYHWYYSVTFKSLETIEPYLRSIGINRSDLVISLPDQSINISLYLMNQKGYSGFGYSHLQDAERMNYLIQKGAKYLIVNDRSILENDYMKPFIQKPLGEYGDTKIFDLREFNLN